jgi:FKBP-type peptidyl-prolyl cis-trans isomerase FkpA
LKHAFTAVAVAMAMLGCAVAQDSKPRADAQAAAPGSVDRGTKGECAPAPKEVVVKDLAPGSGDPVVFRNGAMVFYTGWLYDGCARDLKGEQFDTNTEKMVPLGLIVGAGRVIKGWDEGLIGMKKGGKRLLVIPPDKAYGATARGEKIPANSTLVFEVSLVEITSPPPARSPDKK